jgi:hypothetical protein
MAKHKVRADGRIVQRITINGKPKDIYGRSPTELKDNVEEVLKLARLEVDISDKQTVDEWSIKWFKEYKSEVRYNTLAMYTSIYNAHITSQIGDMRLKDVRQIDIRKVLNNSSKWQFKNKKALMSMLEEANPKHESVGVTKVRVRRKGEWIIQEIVSEFVCPAASGKDMSQTSFYRMWEVIVKRISFKATSHMFRHTFCTTLHKAGIDLRMAQYLMGDSDLKTVAEVYTSIENDQIASADEKIQNVFNADVNNNNEVENVLDVD